MSILFEIRTNTVPSMYLCMMKFTNQYSSVVLEILNSPSQKLKQVLSDNEDWAYQDKNLFDIMLEKMLGEYNFHSTVWFMSDIANVIVSNLNEYKRENNRNFDVDVLIDQFEEKVNVIVLKDGNRLVNFEITSQVPKNRLSQRTLLYNIKTSYSSPNYQEDFHTLSAFDDHFHFPINKYMYGSYYISTQDRFLEKILAFFPSVYTRRELSRGNLYSDTLFGSRDSLYLFEVDKQEFIFALRWGRSKQIDSHTFEIYKVTDWNVFMGYSYNPKPVYSKQYFEINGNTFDRIMKDEDWETILEVLGHRLTEMFKKAFRREYISLNEYKTCELNYKIQELYENMLWSYGSREITGKNEKRTLVTFKYEN